MMIDGRSGKFAGATIDHSFLRSTIVQMNDDRWPIGQNLPGRPSIIRFFDRPSFIGHSFRSD
jgi:hypothetical protein